jgi:4-alpha-glucanotransferase
MGEIGPGNSPYMSSSTFAGNILLIDLADLAAQGWLAPEEMAPEPDFEVERVDFARVQPFRVACLRRAAQRFFATASSAAYQAYDAFCHAEREWLNDYALFKALSEREQERDWNEWPAELVRREPAALRQAEAELADSVAFWKFCQWCFARQWQALKQYANARGIRIIGDVPIFVAWQSADVWAHQDLFELDERGYPTVVAGVPPDYFSETGQLWGNPLYRWDRHAETGYAWWLARLRHALSQCDIVRVDHFRGFAAYWEIPADAPTAVSGRWVPGPGTAFFSAVEQALANLAIIAEDLGVITPDVAELRDQFHLPGMRVLQFAFGDNDANPFLPHNYIANTVAYIGTHDNDTAVGWWDAAPPHVQDFARRYLGIEDGHDIQWTMMGALSRSVANRVVFTMQDVLGLGSEARMNYPGKPERNWEWRFCWEQLQPEYAERLAEMAEQDGRRATPSKEND